MKEYKVGDKVKFLNREGGGVISRVVSPSLVNVREDGFDIPTLTSEIILDYVDDKAGKMFTSEKTTKEEHKEILSETDSESLSDKTERFFLSRKGQQMSKGVYLAFVPEDQVWILTKGLDLYLFNNTDYKVLYSIVLKQNDETFFCKSSGLLDVKQRLHLDKVSSSQAEQWSKGCVQILMVKDKDDKVFAPYTHTLNINSSKFYKEGCFTFNDLTSNKAMVIPLALTEKMETIMKKGESKIEIEKIKQEKQDVKPIPVPKPKSFMDKHLTSRTEAEVDLHIEELTENEAHLSSSEKLSIQIEYFRKCLNQAIESNLDKVIFIHGVGHGVLKKAIEQELDQYSFIHYFPASMQKYGVGATEVWIGKNKK